MISDGADLRNSGSAPRSIDTCLNGMFGIFLKSPVLLVIRDVLLIKAGAAMMESSSLVRCHR
jgi:hypothetical protein